MTDHDPKETRDEFRDAVNMTASELEDWLQTDESRSVGMVKGGDTKSEPGGDEAVGHRMGRRIVELKRTVQADYSDDDYDAMRKVIGYIRRHGAQKPTVEEIGDSRWRHSLMNWGHDPMKN